VHLVLRTKFKIVISIVIDTVGGDKFCYLMVRLNVDSDKNLAVVPRIRSSGLNCSRNLATILIAKWYALFLKFVFV